jgi:hypothetical protein
MEWKGEFLVSADGRPVASVHLAGERWVVFAHNRVGHFKDFEAAQREAARVAKARLPLEVVA